MVDIDAELPTLTEVRVRAREPTISIVPTLLGHSSQTRLECNRRESFQMKNPKAPRLMAVKPMAAGVIRDPGRTRPTRRVHYRPLRRQVLRITRLFVLYSRAASKARAAALPPSESAIDDAQLKVRKRGHRQTFGDAPHLSTKRLSGRGGFQIAIFSPGHREGKSN